MAIENALFHLHEELPASGELSPKTLKGTTALIGVFVADPEATMKRAVAAGRIPRDRNQKSDWRATHEERCAI